MLQLIIAGIMATLLMTFYIYTSSPLITARIRIVHILGAMLINFNDHEKPHLSKNVLIIGTIFHYAIGVMFSCITGFLWYKQLAFPGFLYAFSLGLILGVIAVVTWAIFIKMHRFALNVSLKHFLLFVFSGHFIFSLGQLYTFLLLNKILESS